VGPLCSIASYTGKIDNTHPRLFITLLNMASKKFNKGLNKKIAGMAFMPSPLFIKRVNFNGGVISF
jgi:hypothetical protein